MGSKLTQMCFVVLLFGGLGGGWALFTILGESFLCGSQIGDVSAVRFCE